MVAGWHFNSPLPQAYFLCGRYGESQELRSAVDHLVLELCRTHMNEGQHCYRIVAKDVHQSPPAGRVPFILEADSSAKSLKKVEGDVRVTSIQQEPVYHTQVESFALFSQLIMRDFRGERVPRCERTRFTRCHAEIKKHTRPIIFRPIDPTHT